jgi:hypothetical protein
MTKMNHFLPSIVIARQSIAFIDGENSCDELGSNKCRTGHGQGKHDARREANLPHDVVCNRRRTFRQSLLKFDTGPCVSEVQAHEGTSSEKMRPSCRTDVLPNPIDQGSYSRTHLVGWACLIAEGLA